MVESEKYIAQKVLPKLGFEEITEVTPIFRHFPFDILAKKDGNVYGFNATLKPTKRLHRTAVFLSSYLKVNYHPLKGVACSYHPLCP